jgi:hypothetical protein|nr:DUF4190 domain-containing protein [Kofleriaceae bacterium]
MNCPTCQTQLADGSPFCSTCGANLGGFVAGGPQAPMYGGNQFGGYAQPMMPTRTSGMAVAGFVLALLSCSLLGLIFSIIGYNECKKSLGTVKGEGLALAGIIISIVWFGFTFLWFAAMSGRSSHY